MRFLWLSVVKDLWRARRDPLSFVTWIGIPLVVAVMLNFVFGGGGSAQLPKGRLLITDEDRSVASGILTGAFSREPLDTMLIIEKVGREEGRRRIDKGEASAFLLIPKGLQQAFLRNQPFRIQLLTNPSQRISPQIIEESLSIMVECGFYVQRVASAEMRAADAEAIYRRVSSLSKGLDPPLIALEAEVIREQKRTKSVAEMFLPTMLFMAIWMIASIQASDFWKEREWGVLRRVAVAPARLASFLAGRLVFVALVFGALSVAGLMVARWTAGVPVANLPAAAAWGMLSGTAFYLLMLLLTMLASSQHAAHVLVNLVAFPFALVGGCFFPFDIMPAWMSAIGRLTPNGWAVQQFSSLLSGSVRAGELLTALAALVGVSALAFVLALRRLRRSFAL